MAVTQTCITQHHYKVVDDNSSLNTDTARNKLTERATRSGQIYTDIIVSCLLDYGEPTVRRLLTTQVILMILTHLMNLV